MLSITRRLLFIMNKTNKAMLIRVLRTVKNISVPGLYAVSQNYLFILINEIKSFLYFFLMESCESFLG